MFRNTVFSVNSKMARLGQVLCVLALLATTAATEAQEVTHRLAMNTDHGKIEIELYGKAAPITVANFMRYVKEDFYFGTTFHRVVPGFVIQGGGFTFEFQKKETHEAIKNESQNGLSNLPGTLAMARTPAPDSATSQFFINLADNSRLDYREGQPGYTVFGKMTQGVEVVEKILAEPRGRMRGFPESPNLPVRILDIKIELEPAATPQSKPAQPDGGN